MFPPFQGLHLNACVSAGGGLLDNYIEKTLLGSAISLLQMLKVCFTHFIVHSILSFKKKKRCSLKCLKVKLHYIYIFFF